MREHTPTPLVENAPDADKPYFVEVDQNGCASCGHDRMWTVVGPDGAAASKSWGDEEEAEWFCECMNEAFAVGQANPPAKPADAKFVMRACNNHESLLRACKAALAALKGREHDGFLRDAIAKAEAP